VILINDLNNDLNWSI